jgi:hypothetical protein
MLLYSVSQPNKIINCNFIYRQRKFIEFSGVLWSTHLLCISTDFLKFLYLFIEHVILNSSWISYVVIMIKQQQFVFTVKDNFLFNNTIA